MEVVSQVVIRPQNKPINVLSNKGILRKKSSPYMPSEPIPLRAKTKTPDSKDDDEVTVLSDSVRSCSQDSKLNSEQNNYELLLQQQQLFLQWQHNEDQQQQTQEERQGTQMYELQTRTPPQTQSPNTVLTRRLSDYKVQELKNECKKRQLPVSGAKPQLLERLKPFEKAIVGASPSTPDSTKEPTQETNTCATQETNSIQEMQTQSTVQCPPISSAVHHHAIQEQLRSSQVTINDYLQSQNRPVVLHLPSATPQLVQLVDVKGAVLGMATLQYQGAVETNQQQTVLPQQSRTMAHQISSVGQDTIPALAHSSVGSGPVTSLSQPKIVQATHILQKPNENTFRFAQMGSGGQFTVVPPNDRSTGTLRVIGNTPVTSHINQAHVSQNINGHMLQAEPPSSIHVPSATPTSSTSLMVAFQSTPTKTTNFQHQENAQAQNVSEERLRSPSLQDSPRTADQAGSSPNMPHGGGTNQGDETCLDPMNGMETGNETDENHITLDPSDPSSVLTPATLSMHEDMLRSHQKKIEGLLKELSKSQIQLKQQQQLILTAKKAQQRLREQQRDINEHSRADRDQWLRELDIRQHNKQHIQQFLQHRKQQITLQQQSVEHNRLATTEVRLQEELHVEQAVHDIVRLIKQDARTALLIVQLLRRYQVERNQAENDHHLSTSPECEKIPPHSESNFVRPQQHYQHINQTAAQLTHDKVYHQISRTQSILMEKDDQSVIICEASGIQPANHPHVYSNNDDLMTADKAQAVDMEEIFKSVLEDATRAMNDSTPTQSVECTITNRTDLPKQMSVECQQWKSTVNPDIDVISKEAVVCLNVSNSDSMHHEVTLQLENSHSDSNSLGNAMIDSQRTNQQVMTTGRQQYELQAGNQTHPEYSPDIDDIMAVLRDDQDGTIKSNQFQMELGVGYGSEELADLLGDDWLDCADRSIATNGQYAPYQNDSHDNTCGRSTDPMCMSQAIDDGNSDQMNMDWLDVMLQNAPIEQRPFVNN